MRSMELQAGRSARGCGCNLITESWICKGRSVRYRSATESLITRRSIFCCPTVGRNCSGSISWRKQGSHPPTPTGGGSSGSLTRGTSEERTIVDKQQAGRVNQKEHNNTLEAWRGNIA